MCPYGYFWSLVGLSFVDGAGDRCDLDKPSTETQSEEWFIELLSMPPSLTLEMRNPGPNHSSLSTSQPQATPSRGRRYSSGARADCEVSALMLLSMATMGDTETRKHVFCGRFGARNCMPQLLSDILHFRRSHIVRLVSLEAR